MNLTIDLGNYNTILTFGGDNLEVAGLLRTAAREHPLSSNALLVPSIVNLAGEGVFIGEEVTSEGKYDLESTFRDLKDHIMHAAPLGQLVEGRKVTHKEAASLYLNELVRRLKKETGTYLDIVIICPTFEGEEFVNWIKTVTLSDARSISLVDEDTAVALGYGLDLFKDDLNVFFDFGFSSIRARLVQFHWLGRESYTVPVVRASAMYPVGTADIKQKIIEELNRQRLRDDGGKKLVLHETSMTDEEFYEYAQREDLGATTQRLLDRLWEEAQARGIDKDSVKKVCLIGGATRIPAVRAILVKNFGDKIFGEIPETAAGLGGLGFLVDRPADDMIRQSYSMKVRDPITGQYHHQLVVERYTRYPTRFPTARYIVNTYYDGQYELHLQLYRTGKSTEDIGSREIIIGDDGKISFVTSRSDDVHELIAEPFVIPLSPPGRVGERRLLLEFKVDNLKRLTCTAKDLREDKIIWDEKPLLTLT
ncbi:hypothetical protein EPN96_12255 [bacterium]|nr:MAG: hypothetical protein EPN96_12255 [bacterium]